MSTKKLSRDEALAVLEGSVSSLRDMGYHSKAMSADRTGVTVRYDVSVGDEDFTLTLDWGRGHTHGVGDDFVVRVSTGWGRGERKVKRTITSVVSLVMAKVSAKLENVTAMEKTVMDKAANRFALEWCAHRQGWKLSKPYDGYGFAHVRIRAPESDKGAEVRALYHEAVDTLVCICGFGGVERKLKLADVQMILTSGAPLPPLL